MSYKVAFKTLGCRLNQYETDAILSDFYRAGFEVVGFNQPADVYIINTCTVTNQGDHKSTTAVNQAIKGKEGAVVVVTGCFAENQRAYLEQRGDIHLIIDNKNKAGIRSIVQAHLKGEITATHQKINDVFAFSVAEKSFHTRSMVKIQDGCDNFCSYCIVPVVRGRAVSRPLNDILGNVSDVLALGYKEIVLTGVNISTYGFNGISFTSLIEQILKIPGDFRVRISSLEPERLGEDFIALFSDPKLCPHLHLCLQSGSDKILRSMRRTYTVSSFLGSIEALRKKQPMFNFTTDVIVGFPGETEQDFNLTCKIAEEVGFGHIHTFKFSNRCGTRAEILPDRINEKVKTERSAVIRKISDRNKEKYRKLFIGKDQTVLVEKVTKKGLARGYGEHYIPVEFHTNATETNYFKKVRIDHISGLQGDFILASNQ